MKAIWKGKRVKVTKVITRSNPDIAYPMIVQVRIEYKENGQLVSNYAYGNEVEFINQ